MKILSSLAKSIIPATIALTSLFVLKGHSLQAKCMSKVDIGPAYVHIDVLESRNTVKELDLAAFRAEASLISEGGWYLKPFYLYGKGHDGELTSYGASIGRCIPIFGRLILTPQVGATYTDLHATFHADIGEVKKFKFQEKFKSLAPFVGIEAAIKLTKCWRLYASAQYAWSHSKTRVKDLITSKSDSEGPNYAAMLEYDLNECWSVNVAAAYNESLSKEKNGIRGHGIKLGIARWF